MDRVVYIIALSLFKVTAWLPLRFSRWLGSLIGSLMWAQGADSRRVTEENVRLCFPDLDEQEQRRLAQASMRHLGMTTLEAGLAWCASSERVLKTVTRIVGGEVMQQALGSGKGVIVLVPHHGNWEIVGLYLSANYPSTFLYQPPENPYLDQLIQRARARNGASLVPTNTSGVKALLRALKRGEVTAILPDQSPPLNSGSFAPFFNIPALTATLTHNLIQRTGASVVMACALRVEGTGEFELHFMPVDDAIYDKDEVTSLTALNAGIEAMVRASPAQYQWEYKRFRKQPGGERKYYRKQ